MAAMPGMSRQMAPSELYLEPSSEYMVPMKLLRSGRPISCSTVPAAPDPPEKRSCSCSMYGIRVLNRAALVG